MGLSNLRRDGFRAILEITDEHVEQIQASFLRAPIMLASELALGVGKEAFKCPLVKPLSHLY